METDSNLLPLITPEQAWHYRVFPRSFLQNRYCFITDVPSFEQERKQEIELLLDKDIQFEQVSTEELTKLLSKHYLINQAESNKKKQVVVEEGFNNNYLDKLIREANQLRSSDIHIECYNDTARIRYRIDGLLIERYFLDKSEYPTLVNRIKILANLDIAEKRLPQDGRIMIVNEDEKFDMRVSVLPALHGEKIVLRLLKNNLEFVNFNNLGFEEQDKKLYQEGIKKPNGIILISGPTGSGKTTTLYATLKLLNSPAKNILTIEDPIEYTLEGVNQVQLKENIGLTFSAALRTFLRQDPDIIMLGEIRDPETAAIAIRASLTGHLVLSTIHTNSAWGIVSRLKDMNVPAYLIADTLNLAVAQRLLRLLCPHCKQKIQANKNEFDLYEVLSQVIEYYKAVGCEKCYFTGYKGRKAIYEVIYNNRDLTEAIKKGTTEIEEFKKNNGIKGLAENAALLFENGETSFEEIYPILITS